MAIDKKDQSVLSHIERLVKEELTDDDRERLAELKLELDQYWDFLRQRRALREFKDDPDRAKVRPGMIVENYEQVQGKRQLRFAIDAKEREAHSCSGGCGLF
jgi:Protein of unknown function (DUF2630)